MAVRARVLILVENLSVPRDQRVWKEALALTRAGCEVVVVCPRGSDRDVERFERREGVDIHRYAATPATGGAGSYAREYLEALLQMSRLTLRLARGQRFDVVHACNPPDVLLLAALPLRLQGTRFVFDHHDLVPELFEVRFGDGHRLLRRATRAVERLCFGLADVVLSTNASFRTVAIERGGKDPDDVFVVRNGPDPERFSPGRPDPALRKAPHVLGYVGTMGAQDGVDHALRALAALARRRSDWHALFAGDGDAVPGLRRLAGELGLAERVEFVGQLDQEAVVRLLSSVDVCLAPEPRNALNDASTLIKVAEYMAMERPVVCFELKESRVTAGGAAAYARANDDDDYAQQIARLLDDPPRRAEMGAIGRARVLDGLSWRHSEQQLLAAYERCLSGAHRRYTVSSPHLEQPT